jgi:hypothetical protein
MHTEAFEVYMQQKGIDLSSAAACQLAATFLRNATLDLPAGGASCQSSTLQQWAANEACFCPYGTHELHAHVWTGCQTSAGFFAQYYQSDVAAAATGPAAKCCVAEATTAAAAAADVPKCCVAEATAAAAAAANAANEAECSQPTTEQHGVGCHGQADSCVEGLWLVEGHLHLHCGLEAAHIAVSASAFIHCWQLHQCNNQSHHPS